MREQYDLCVIGAGPAGIIVTLEYARKNPGKSVALVEYGARDTENALDQSIVIDNLTNHHEPKDTTVKGVGGTSATWGGRCVNYDPVDFIDRPILNGNCTWGKEMIEAYQPFLKTATEYFECGRPVFSTQEMEEFKSDRIADNFENGPVTDHIVERWSMPTRFGARYGEELNETANIDVINGFEARTLAQPDDHGHLAFVTIRQVDNGEEYTLNAKSFVLAAGAQETTRILLRNERVFSRLDKAPDSLGRYYQSHLSGKIASVKFYGNPKKTDYGFMRDKDGSYLRRRFQFSSDFLVERNLLNTAIWLDNPLYYDPSHKSGDLSFMYLAMITPGLGSKLAPPAIARSITKGVVRDVPAHLKNVLRGLPGSLFTPALVFAKRYLPKRKLPGVFLYNPTNRYALHFHSEQVPDANNRMVLGNDGETLNISYRYTEDDVNSIIALHEELDKWLRQCNCGEVEYWHPKEDRANIIREISMDGIHQNGTTRIAGSSENGVVDRDLKVFGTNNLYVCSSSVFPTSGQANPTFLLGTFAVRLAHHLQNTMDQ